MSIKNNYVFYGAVKNEKSGEAAYCPFRFLFGLRKGNRVWDKVPLLPFKSRENDFISLSRKIKR